MGESVVELEAVKVVPSVLFRPRGAASIFVELQVANGNVDPVELHEIDFSILPQPGRGIRRASHLFASEVEEGLPDWRTMFTGFANRPDLGPYGFSYQLDVDEEGEDHTLLAYPANFNISPRTPDSDNGWDIGEASYRVTDIAHLEPGFGNRAIVLRPITRRPEFDVAAFFFQVEFGPDAPTLDESSYIYDFDFRYPPESVATVGPYFRFFGVLPKGGILLGSQSRTRLNTHTPSSVRAMFPKWREISECSSTRTHRVVAMESPVRGSRGIYVEAVVSFPGKRFVKTVASFSLGLVAAVIASVVLRSPDVSTADLIRLLGLSVAATLGMWLIWKY